MKSMYLLQGIKSASNDTKLKMLIVRHSRNEAKNELRTEEQRKMFMNKADQDMDCNRQT